MTLTKVDVVLIMVRMMSVGIKCRHVRHVGM